jgi:hypothetical protein
MSIAKLQRTEDWEQKLFAFTASMLPMPFEWGSNDCMMFAAGCVYACTGQDLAAEYRGTYDTEAGALRVIVAAGVKDLGDFVARLLPEIDPAEAQRGDVILAQGPEAPFIAVCQGATSVGPTAHGLIHVYTNQALRAFKV